MFITSPYLSKSLIKHALSLRREHCIQQEGERESVGKLVLRVAFPNVTSAWRRKDPIEARSLCVG